MTYSGARLIVVTAGLWMSFVIIAWGAQQPVAPSSSTTAPPAAIGVPASTTPTYVLGPDDVIAIKAPDADEISSSSLRIDPSGSISLPLLGRVQAAGLTVQALERELDARLKTYVKQPAVAVTVVEYRSQPVSVIGSVGQPGVHQLEGRKTSRSSRKQAGCDPKPAALSKSHDDSSLDRFH
jgi:polysaccharide biosynthesis/export protein